LVVVARRVGRGIAVLTVVGLCLPLLFWMFGEGEAKRPLPREEQSARAPLARPLAQAPAPSMPSPGESAAAAPEDSEQGRPTPPRGGGIGPEPAWSDPAVWTGQLPPAATGAAPIYTATITGRVVDPAGHPVPGVKISGVLGMISCWGGPSRTTSADQRAVTGPDGRFRLEISSEHLLPSHLGLAPPAETDLLPSQAEIPDLGQGDARDVGDLPLAQGGRIEGHVSNTLGLPLAGVQIRTQQGSLALDRALGGSVVLANDASWGSGLSHTSAIRGLEPVSTADAIVFSSSSSNAFRGGLVLSSEELGPTTRSRADGSFTLHAVPPGNHTLVALLRPYSVSRRDAIAVRAGATTRGVRLSLAPGLVLEVEVLDSRGRPIPRAAVTGTDDEGASFVTLTDAQGVATSPPLTSRRFDVQVTAAGQRSTSSALTAPAGSKRFRLRVTMGSASEIRFRTPAEGSILQPASVFAIRRGTSVWVSPEQEGNTYSFRELPPGRYDVLGNGPKGLLTLAQDVRVRGDDRVDLGLLTPTPTEPLRVRVLDAKGLPIPGATLEPLGAPLGAPSTDESGLALLNLWPGEHPHRVVAHGHAEATHVFSGSGEQVVRLAPATTFLRVNAARVLDDQGALRARQLTLRRPGASPISITFLDQAQVPLPAPGRYAVDIDDHACGEVEVKAGQTLEFTAPEPQAVEVELTLLSAEGRAVVGAEVTLTSGDPRPGSTQDALFSPVTAPIAHTNARGVAKVTLERGAAIQEVFAQVVSEGKTLVFPLSLPAESRLTRTLQFPRSSSATLEVDAGGLGQPGSLVELKPLTAVSARTQVASLDANGRVVFQGVLPGRYRVTLFADEAQTSREVEVTGAGAEVTLGSS